MRIKTGIRLSHINRLQIFSWMCSFTIPLHLVSPAYGKKDGIVYSDEAMDWKAEESYHSWQGHKFSLPEHPDWLWGPPRLFAVCSFPRGKTLSQC
jgi:hypothetical protein